MNLDSNIDLDKINADLKDRSAEEIVQWALQNSSRVITTSSFSPNSAALLHLITRIKADMPVVWIDSGYNMPDAYRVAEQIIQQLKLNIHVYTPLMTAERRNALMGGIPHPADDAELHAEFTRQVKLEPFQRALDEFKPEIWLTGIRREETDFRKTLDIVSWDNRGLLRVAPLFHWREQDVQDYMDRFQLPTCKHYFDPTKVADNAECGLHTAA
jgi:phosphoadenosine phosphosulfate reductase